MPYSLDTEVNARFAYVPQPNITTGGGHLKNFMGTVASIVAKEEEMQNALNDKCQQAKTSIMAKLGGTADS